MKQKRAVEPDYARDVFACEMAGFNLPRFDEWLDELPADQHKEEMQACRAQALAAIYGNRHLEAKRCLQVMYLSLCVALLRPDARIGARAKAKAAGLIRDEPERVVRRSDLVNLVRHEWPTIENDLKSAAKNGLKIANQERGLWGVNRARKWAQDNGRMRQQTSALGLQGMWSEGGRVHKME